MSSDHDDNELRVDFSAKELATSKDELPSVIVHQPIAGSFLSGEVATEESQLEAKHRQTYFITGVLASPVSCTKAIITVILLLLAATLLQSAHAEPTETNVLDTSLTLSAPTPRVTAFNAFATPSKGNKSIDVQAKDHPQTWYWHPNSSHRTSTSSLMMLLPLFLIGYFVLPSFASGTPTKAMEIAGTTVLAARTATSKTSPTMNTYYSTTTVYPPTFGTLTPDVATSKSVNDSLITGGSCEEADQASCSVVPGRISSSSTASNVTLLAVIAGFAVAIAFVV